MAMVTLPFCLVNHDVSVDLRVRLTLVGSEDSPGMPWGEEMTVREFCERWPQYANDYEWFWTAGYNDPMCGDEVPGGLHYFGTVLSLVPVEPMPPVPAGERDYPQVSGAGDRRKRLLERAGLSGTIWSNGAAVLEALLA
jgi:hypothetical protein